jgi:hypothetical protein
MSDILRSVSPADPADEVGRFAIWDEETLDEAVLRARAAFAAAACRRGLPYPRPRH